MTTLEQAIGDERYAKTETNHFFFKMVAPLAITTVNLERAIAAVLPAYAKLIQQMQAYELELVVPIWAPGHTDVAPKTMRIIARLAPSIDIKIYEEVAASAMFGGSSKTELRLLNGSTAEPKMLLPYEQLSSIDQKRLKCLKLATTYAYDYTHLFELAVSAAWESAPAACGSAPAEKVRAVELVLARDNSAVEPLPTPRAPGTNKVGMVAWILTLFTPEYVSGREIVVIANDITYANGTFGPLEDVLFEKASQFARRRGIPRIYLGANSGARFGLSESVRKCFRVQWNDPFDFTRGINYLWLTDKDAENLGSAVVTQRVPVPPVPSYDDESDGIGRSLTEDDELSDFHNKIVSIIGKEVSEAGFKSNATRARCPHSTAPADGAHPTAIRTASAWRACRGRARSPLRPPLPTVRSSPSATRPRATSASAPTCCASASASCSTTRRRSSLPASRRSTSCSAPTCTRATASSAGPR